MSRDGRANHPLIDAKYIVRNFGNQLRGIVKLELSVKAMIRDGVAEIYERGPMKRMNSMLVRIDLNSWKAATTTDE